MANSEIGSALSEKFGALEAKAIAMHRRALFANGHSTHLLKTPEDGLTVSFFVSQEGAHLKIREGSSLFKLTLQEVVAFVQALPEVLDSPLWIQASTGSLHRQRREFAANVSHCLSLHVLVKPREPPGLLIWPYDQEAEDDREVHIRSEQMIELVNAISTAIDCFDSWVTQFTHDK